MGADSVGPGREGKDGRGQGLKGAGVGARLPRRGQPGSALNGPPSHRHEPLLRTAVANHPTPTHTHTSTSTAAAAAAATSPTLTTSSTSPTTTTTTTSRHRACSSSSSSSSSSCPRQRRPRRRRLPGRSTGSSPLSSLRLPIPDGHPDAYSPPPYHDPSPHHHYHRHGGDDFLPADEIRRVGGGHHHHHHHPQLQQLLPWEEAEEERRRYGGATQQLRLSPSGPRKRQRGAVHDADVESTSSSGPPPRRQRQQPHPDYALDDSFVDRNNAHPGYMVHEGFSIHSDSKVSRKIQMPTQMALPGSPHGTSAGYARRAPQKVAPSRVSVWHRIEENPAMYEPSSPPPHMPKEVHVSPCKSNNVAPASKELASVISVDCRGKSADGNDGDSNTGTKKNPVKKNEKVLASVLVKPPMEPKEKEVAAKKMLKKPDKVQKNAVHSNIRSLVSTPCPGAGAKKVKKIVIKKIVRKINGKGNQNSTPVVSEKRDGIDANACEKEEGEITTSSFEKDVISAHDPIAVSDTAGFGNAVNDQKQKNTDFTNPSGRNAASANGSMEIPDPPNVVGLHILERKRF
ncbi:hypothetical protein OsI_23830 [Oryza sativa Indica Group]|uniref:Uncharacterized protein n=1 Tax=Oryza sativa subsp. indica TaxID=39946 RepID=B8B0H5_ORYSI|nr:hypothetical protein OsI_23830 [Oryza sativa Indica Group]